MYLLLNGLIVLAALLMCFVVLIQNSKGGGLASSFASSNQIMGVRKTTDFIEKLTWGLAAFMVACSVLTAYFVPAAHTDSSVIMEEAVKEGATNPTKSGLRTLSVRLRLLLMKKPPKLPHSYFYFLVEQFLLCFSTDPPPAP